MRIRRGLLDSSLIRCGSIVVLAVAGLALPAVAGGPGPIELNPARLAADEPAEAAQAQPGAESAEAVTTREEVQAQEEAEEKLPITLGVSYYLLSDYVFRGINFSEYTRGRNSRGEGRERLNHQVTTALTYDAGDFGKFGFDTFFEWYEAQAKLNPYGGGQNLQEVDYIIRWTYPIKAISTDATLGYTFYTFPNLAKLLRQDRLVGNNNDDRTHEWWFKLNHNDAWAWKWLFPDNESGILNPYYLFAQDVGIGSGAVYMELGFSHPFTIPGIDNFTITPSYMLAGDGGYLKRLRGKPHHDYLRLAYDQWALNMTYDLTPVLHLPKWAGTVSVSGLLYFNNAFGSAARENDINDEFWGGMSVNWAWGG